MVGPLMLALALLSDLDMDLGELEIAAPRRAVRWQGLFGAPSSAAESAALQSALGKALRQAGYRMDAQPQLFALELLQLAVLYRRYQRCLDQS